MKTIEQNELTIEDLDNLASGKYNGILIPESDYGLAEIDYEDGKFKVSEIPMYGGEPSLQFLDSNTQLTLSYVQNIT